MLQAVRPLSAALALLALPAVAVPAPAQEDAALRRARAVLDAAPVLDAHNDLPWVIREKAAGRVEAFDIATRARFDTDLPRLREGRVGTQFWSVYVPSGLPPAEAVTAQLEQIDIARRIIDRYPRDLGFAGSVADIERERRAGRIASLLGIEGGHTINNSLGALRAFYDLGVRYMTLTHFHGNDWADAATDSVRHGGLTRFGEEVVREMNRLGMLVDLSHVSPGAMSDALNVTEAPVIFSHSSARAVTDHVRNVPDSILRRLPANGGVVMVAFVPQFISEPVRQWNAELWPLITRATSDSQSQRLTREYVARRGAAPRATVADLADHIEHVVRVAGIDHVGIGADYYGAEAEHDLVQGLEDVSKYPALFAELVRRGWSDAHLRKLARENLLRAFAAAESVAARLRATRPPSTATIGQLDRRPTP
jgi:membrane dipeptidase